MLTSLGGFGPLQEFSRPGLSRRDSPETNEVQRGHIAHACTMFTTGSALGKWEMHGDARLRSHPWAPHGPAMAPPSPVPGSPSSVPSTSAARLLGSKGTDPCASVPGHLLNMRCRMGIYKSFIYLYAFICIYAILCRMPFYACKIECSMHLNTKDLPTNGTSSHAFALSCWFSSQQSRV